MESPPTPVEHCCTHCGGTAVTRDAWVEWEVAQQAWVISALFDFAFCHHCHRQTQLVERAVSTLE